MGGTGFFVTSPVLPDPRPAARPARLRGAPGLLAPVVVTLGAGLTLSGVDLLTMAYASAHAYDTALVPWVLGAMSAGSVLGGLANGAVRWLIPARTRLLRFSAGLGLIVAVAGLAPALWVLTAALALAGALIAPTLTTAYLAADESVAAESRTQAGAWVNMGVNAGSSAGALATGLLIGRMSLAVCFLVAGGTALASAAAAGAGGLARSRRG